MSRTLLIPCAAATLALSLLGALSPAGAASAGSATAEAQTQAPRPTCNGRVATIVGTPGDDRIRGTRRGDVIVGRGGNDTIQGFGRNDTICGNVGADDLYGGAGRDVLLGGADQVATDIELDEYWADMLQGGPGNDVLDVGVRSGWHIPNVVSFNRAKRGVRVNLGRGTAVGEGHDRIRGRGRIAVLGSRHADTIIGSARNEILMGSRGNDRVHGGGGHDEVEDGAGWAKGQGYNWVPGPQADTDVLSGGRHGDGVYGDRKDTVFGGGGNDSIIGGPVQRGGPGHDTLSAWINGVNQAQMVLGGGAGRDHLQVEVKRGLGGLETDLRSGRSKLVATGVSFRLAGMEEMELANLRTPWTVFGTAKSEKFWGGGPMTVRAGGGNDQVFTGAHDDYVHGGPGRDNALTWGGEDTCVSIERAPGAGSCEIRR